MRWIFKVAGALLLFGLFAFALGWVTMLLWNWLVPSLFSGPQITYWEAAGLMILGRLLVGGFGGKSCCHGDGGGWHHKRGMWKKRWEEKMACMSPEEKEKFMRGMNKCGWKYEESEKTQQNAGGGSEQESVSSRQ